MKTTIIAAMILLLGAGSSIAQEPDMGPYHLAMEQPYKEGEVIVKFKDDQNISFYKSGDMIITGRSDLDAAFAQWSVQDASQVFRNTVKKNETRVNTFPDGTQRPLPQFHNIFLLSFPKTNDPLQVAEALNALEDVEYAEPNLTFFITGSNALSPLLNEEDLPKVLMNSEKEGVTPNDPLYNQQWYLPHIKADQLWNTETGDDTQVIAIMDTGVDWTHPDLQNKIWQNPYETLNGHDSDGNGFVDDIRGWDFVNNNNNPMDDNSHGTHCAGLAAAETDNGIGIAGVSWGARIMPVKVFHSNGTGYAAQIAEGIWYAANNGATISSNSWGGYGESITIRLAFEYAYFHGPIVAAAGNSGYKLDYPYPPWPPTGQMYPACYSWVIGVEATEPSGANAWFSNYDPTGPILTDDSYYGGYFNNPYGHNYEVRAPGQGLISTVPGGQYRVYSGTSMAAPLVAGGIALMKSQEPELSNDMIFTKLIQPVKINIFQAGVMDLIKSTSPVAVEPDLHHVSHHFVDTIYGGNGNGRVDVGETIEIFVTVRNLGGPASNVKTKLRFTEFEDQTTANILNNTSTIGSISTYGTGSNYNALLIEFSDDLAHGRQVSFQLLAWTEGLSDTIYQGLSFMVYNGIEIKGVIEGLVHLQEDAYYIIMEPAEIDSLIIEPGITLRFSNNSFLIINHYLYAVGTPEDRITFMAADYSRVNSIKMQQGAYSEFQYCLFKDGFNNTSSAYLQNPTKVHHCVFTENMDMFLIDNVNQGASIKYNVFTENINMHHHSLINYGNLFEFMYNVIYSNGLGSLNVNGLTFAGAPYPELQEYVTHNVFISNHRYSVATWTWWPMGVYKIMENYWGTTNIEEIKADILDFYEDSSRPVLEPDTILHVPPAECHGHVWKVLINDQNPQYDDIGAIGAGQVKFEVYFNRPMDVSFTPFVTFGVRMPFTQNLVADDASWSEDSLVWTAYASMNMNTGDGLNTVRVAYARDNEGFEIPIERERFTFELQVAGSLSVDFYAQPEANRIHLHWPVSEEDNTLGYNLYRFKIEDSLHSDTLLLNSSLIMDSTFVDYAVIPDYAYYYMFTTMYTDFEESDFSKVVAAIPYATASGDANGDYNVDVLDITTIVAFILGHDPKPFIFDAADVNQDEVINVMDVVGVLNLILQNKEEISPIIQTHPDPANIHIDKHIIRLESNGQISALQFTLNTKYPDLLQLTSMLPGFELATAVTDDGIRGILFNMQGNTIPAGLTDIIRMEYPNYDLGWGELAGACPEGRYVEILTAPLNIDTSLPLPKDFHLEVFPNPASGQFTINYFMPVASDVRIELYDIIGRRLHNINHTRQPAGEHHYILNPGMLGNPKGLVLIRITAAGVGGQLFEKTKRIVLAK